MMDVRSQIQSPELRRLYDYWDAQKAGRDYPTRADLDPRELRYVLGDMLLLDVLRDPLRFRFRLHGTNLVTRAGYDMTGRLVDDMPGESNRSLLLERCRTIVETGQPIRDRHYRVLQGLRYHYEVLWLPLAGEDGQINMLLGALRYDETPLTARPESD